MDVRGQECLFAPRRKLERKDSMPEVISFISKGGIDRSGD